MGKLNDLYWLLEMDVPANNAPPGGAPPAPQPGLAGDPMGMPEPAPPDAGPAPVPTPQPQDTSNDPQYPEMPGMEEDRDFEAWKMQFVKETIKGDPNTCLDLIAKVRDKELESHQARFVENNYQIFSFRQHLDILNPSAQIRKLLKQELDRNQPSTSIVNHMTKILDENPLLNTMYIKLKGCSGGRGDYHRKFIGALLGAFQVGNGKKNEDLIFEDTDYSVQISTRFASEWGNIMLGPWSMKEDDPERYLKSPELNRLQGGSPEEKDVLRRRIIMESISDMFQQRAFLIDIVDDQGTVQHIGLDLGNCLRAAYVDGRLVARTGDTDSRNAFISEEGEIIIIPNLSINYVREADLPNAHGEHDLEEIEFMRQEDGMLRLTATTDLMKEVASTLQGIVWKEQPWQGNPSDLMGLMRSVPSVAEMLLTKRY